MSLVTTSILSGVPIRRTDTVTGFHVGRLTLPRLNYLPSIVGVVPPRPEKRPARLRKVEESVPGGPERFWFTGPESLGLILSRHLPRPLSGQRSLPRRGVVNFILHFHRGPRRSWTVPCSTQKTLYSTSTPPFLLRGLRLHSTSENLLPPGRILGGRILRCQEGRSLKGS